jgi:hypothetical protein
LSESEQFTRYLFEYRHEGSEWALEVRARDLDDAKARLKAMPWAQYRGEIVLQGSIPGGGLFSLWSRLFRSQPESKRDSRFESQP